MRRIVITGSSGYLGSCLINYLRERVEQIQILGIDVIPPPLDRTSAQPDEFRQLDVADSVLVEVVRGYQPDTVIHYAFQVEPVRDRKLAFRSNITGTKNVLNAIAEAQPERALIASSASAFGASPAGQAHADYDIPQGRPEFTYSRHKSEQEALIREFADSNPAIATCWIRPCIVAGPHMNNYILRALTMQPFVFLMSGHDIQMQLVHEEDVNRAVVEILARNCRGPFNIALRETLTFSQIAAVNPRKQIAIPFWLARTCAAIAWQLRIPSHELPPGFLYFCRYPWIALPNRLENELAFKFEYSVQQTLQEIAGQYRRLYGTKQVG